MMNLFEKTREQQYSKEKTSKILELTEYFKNDSYNLHKFVNAIKKPKVIKFLQEDFYYTLIHYIVISSLWLDYEKIQQLWYSISWLKIIKDNYTHPTLTLVLKQKEKKPLLTRLKTSSSNSSVFIKPKLRRSSTMHLLESINEIEDDEYNTEDKNTNPDIFSNAEISVLFDQTPQQLTDYSYILLLGNLKALDVLKILQQNQWIDYHVDFDKSCQFLLNEIKMYFR